jgi:hypothetical protein
LQISGRALGDLDLPNLHKQDVNPSFGQRIGIHSLTFDNAVDVHGDPLMPREELAVQSGRSWSFRLSLTVGSDGVGLCCSLDSPPQALRECAAIHGPTRLDGLFDSVFFTSSSSIRQVEFASRRAFVWPDRVLRDAPQSLGEFPGFFQSQRQSAPDFRHCSLFKSSLHGRCSRMLSSLMDDQVPEECIAGGRRVAVGSGQKGTCVTIRHPPETWVAIFFLRGGFPTANRISGELGINGAICLHAVTRLPAPSAVEAKYPVGARPSKCIIIVHAASIGRSASWSH